jgi:hypothetical protein
MAARGSCALGSVTLFLFTSLPSAISDLECWSAQRRTEAGGPVADCPNVSNTFKFQTQTLPGLAGSPLPPAGPDGQHPAHLATESNSLPSGSSPPSPAVRTCALSCSRRSAELLLKSIPSTACCSVADCNPSQGEPAAPVSPTGHGLCTSACVCSNMARGVETCDLTPRRGESTHNPSSFLDHSHSSPPPLRVPEMVTLPTVRGMAAPPAPVPDLTAMTVNLASGPPSAHYFRPPSTVGPKTFLQVLFSSAPAPINIADGKRSRRSRSLPPSQNQCFRCLSTDHLVAACRDPVRCRSCLRHGHRSYSCEMAGTFSRSLRLGASWRSSPGADSAPPPCFTSPPLTSARSSWLSPTIDRRVERGSIPVPTTAAGRQRSRSPTPAARGRGGLPSVHFAPTPLGASAAGPPRHRA